MLGMINFWKKEVIFKIYHQLRTALLLHLSIKFKIFLNYTRTKCSNGSSFENQKCEREIDALHQFRWEPTINNHWTGAKLSQQRRVPLERGQTDARCSDTILTSAIPVPIQPVKVIESEIIEVWRRRVEGASWSKIERKKGKEKRKEGRMDVGAKSLDYARRGGTGGDESSVEKWLVSGR